MKPWQWYAYGIMPMQGVPMNVIRYMTTGITPTAAGLAAGAVGSTITSYGLGYMISPKIPEAMLYHKMRMLGLGIEGIHKGTPFLHKGSGVVWRFPLWARFTMSAVAGYQAGNEYVNFAYSDPQQMNTPGKLLHRRLFGALYDK